MLLFNTLSSSSGAKPFGGGLLLLTMWMFDMPKAVIVASGGDISSGIEGGRSYFHDEQNLLKERLLREDNEVLEILKTFIRCL